MEEYAAMPALGSRPVSAVVVADPDEVREARALRGQVRSSTPARRLAAQLLDVLPVGLMALWGWRLPDRAASGLIFVAVAIVLTRSLVVQRLGVHPSNRSTVGAIAAVAAGLTAALVDLSGVGAPGDRWGRALAVAAAVMVVSMMWTFAASKMHRRAGGGASARGVLRSSPGLAVLLVLDSSNDALSVAALARALGMPAPVAQQWLGTLTSLGLVRVDRDLAMWAITPTGRRVLDEHLGGFVASA